MATLDTKPWNCYSPEGENSQPQWYISLKSNNFLFAGDETQALRFPGYKTFCEKWQKDPQFRIRVILDEKLANCKYYAKLSQIVPHKRKLHCDEVFQDDEREPKISKSSTFENDDCGEDSDSKRSDNETNILPDKIIEKSDSVDVDELYTIGFGQDRGLFRCLCGRIWDGNAQCFPCDALIADDTERAILNRDQKEYIEHDKRMQYLMKKYKMIIRLVIFYKRIKKER